MKGRQVTKNTKARYSSSAPQVGKKWTRGNYQHFIKFCSSLRINRASDGAYVPFILNGEQNRIAKAFFDSAQDGGPSRTVVIKPRQIGVSTFVLALITYLSLANQGDHTIGIAVDTITKARNFIDKVSSLFDQIDVKLKVKKNADNIVLANGIKIMALTAGGGAAGEESNAGRGYSFRFLLCSEVAYWANSKAFDSLEAATANGDIICESSANGKGSSLSGARLLYDLSKQNKSWNVLHFLVEDQEEYQADPDAISNKKWVALQKLGFKSRSHAAWWQLRLEQKSGDIGTHLRDYPVTEEHCWNAGGHRFINVDPEVHQAHPHPNIQALSIYPNWSNFKYVVGVDTAGGTGRDASAISVVNWATKELEGFYYDSNIEIDDIVSLLEVIYNKLSIITFVIEKDGVGRATVQYAKKAGLPVTDYSAFAHGAKTSVLVARRAVEEGVLFGPQRIFEEVQSVTWDSKRSKFVGIKDGLVSYGIARHYIDSNPYVPPREKFNSQIYLDPKKYLRRVRNR